MSETVIKLFDNGPLLVSGPVTLLDASGGRFETKEACALCRCGLSQTRPFCDGTHRGQFEDQTRAGH